jgi:methyl-accepting chemotaxis protein
MNKEIEKIIHEVQLSIQSVVQGMDKTELVKQNQEKALAGTVKAFNEVSESINLIHEKIDSISEATNHLNKNANDAVSLINDVASIAQETAAVTEEIAASAQEQNTAMHNIVESSRELTQIASELDNNTRVFLL